MLTQVASVKDIDLCCLGNELAEVALEQLASGTLAVNGLPQGTCCVCVVHIFVNSGVACTSLGIWLVGVETLADDNWKPCSEGFAIVVMPVCGERMTHGMQQATKQYVAAHVHAFGAC